MSASNHPDPKDYATAQARLAIFGYSLVRSHRVPDGQVTYLVQRHSHTRAFTHFNDVDAFLRQLMDAGRVVAE